MLKFNQQLAATQNSRKRKEITVTFDREGKYDNEAVLVITAQQNQCKLPKGRSQELLGAKDGDAIAIVANYHDNNFTREMLEANLSADIFALIPIMTGAEIKNAVANGTFAPNLDADARALYLNGTEDVPGVEDLFEDEEEYGVPSFIYVKYIPSLT